MAISPEHADNGREARTLIRLLAAFAAAVLSGGYVLAYNVSMQAVQLPCDFRPNRLAAYPALTRFCEAAAPWWFVVPAVALAAGLGLRRRRKPNSLEFVVAVTWLLALSWILFAHLAWLLPAYPLCGPVRT